MNKKIVANLALVLAGLTHTGFAMTSVTADNTTATHNTNKTTTDLFVKTLLSDGLTGARYEGLLGIENVDSLNYLTSKSLECRIPSNTALGDLKITIDWGFVGAGEHNLELLLPLPSIKVNVDLDDSNAKAAGKQNPITALGAAFLKNEIQRFGNIEQVLEQFKIAPVLKPRAVFLLKVGMLAKHAVEHNDFNLFVNDFGFLLCRLFASGDLAATGSLRDLIPQSILDAINEQLPGTVATVEDIFTVVKNLFDTKNQDHTKTFAYVFSNTQTAATFASFMQAQINNPFCERDCETKLAELGLQVIEVEADALDQAILQDQTNPIFSNMVIKVITYAHDQAALASGINLTQPEVASINVKGSVTTLQKDKLSVVCGTSDKGMFDAVQTISGTAAMVSKAWAAYLAIIENETKQGHNLDAAATDLLLPAEIDRKLLKTFLQSDEGKVLTAQLEEKLQQACQPFMVTVSTKHVDEKNEIIAKLEKLDAIQKEKALLLDEKIATKTRIEENNEASTVKSIVEKLSQTIERLQSEIAITHAEILNLSTKLDEYNAETANNTASEKRLEIYQLLNLLQQQQAHGQAGDADLRSRLSALEQEMTQHNHVEKNNATKKVLSIDEKIELRRAIKNTYNAEITSINEQIKALDQVFSIQNIQQKANLSLYRKSLEARVIRMEEQEQQLQQLVAYKAIIQDGGFLSESDQARFCQLENKLGFIIESQDLHEISRVTKPTPSVVARFVTELSNPMPHSAFEPMHNNFVADLSNLLQKSQLAQENQPVVKHLLGVFFPTLPAHTVHGLLNPENQ